MTDPTFRNKPRRHFTVVRNTALRDNTISLKAKGLLALMLSFPDDWTYHLTHLEGLSTDGRDATRTAARELETAGYITRHQTRTPDGRLSEAHYEVADVRNGTRTVDGLSGDGKTVAGKTVAGKPATTKTERTKTERPTKTDSTKPARKRADSTFDPLSVELPEHVDPQAWADFVEHRREIHKKLTPTATKRLIADLAKHPAAANDALRKSVKNGWTGVFPEGANGKPKVECAPADYTDATAADLLTPTSIGGRWNN